MNSDGSSNVRLAVATYTEEQFEKLQQLADDPHVLHDSYEEWVAAHIENMQRFRANGMNPEPIQIDVEELAEWCEQEDRPLDGSARSSYASMMAKQKSQD